MTDIRVVNYKNIYLEEPKLKLAENFVDAQEDFDILDEVEKQDVIQHVAKMATAAECFIFDAEVDASHLNFQVYEFEDGRERIVLLMAEKTEEGVVSQIVWTDAEGLKKFGITEEELRTLGFEH
jgi:hypothetical protein